MALVDVVREAVNTQVLNTEKSVTVAGYNDLFRASFQSGEGGKADALLKDMKAANIKPNLETCKIFVEGADTFEKAEKCFILMQLGGVAPDTEVYNTLLKRCFAANKPERAQFYLQEMEKNNKQKTRATFTILVEGYTETKQFAKAKEVIAEMQNSNVSPKIVQKFGTSFEAAIKKMEELELDSFHLIFKQFFARGAFDKIENAFEAMKSPHPSTYKLLIVEYCKCKQLGAAVTHLANMRGQKLKPDIDTYNTLFKAAGEDKEKVREFLIALQEDRVAPNRETKDLFAILDLTNLLTTLRI